MKIILGSILAAAIAIFLFSFSQANADCGNMTGGCDGQSIQKEEDDGYIDDNNDGVNDENDNHASSNEPTDCVYVGNNVHKCQDGTYKCPDEVEAKCDKISDNHKSSDNHDYKTSRDGGLTDADRFNSGFTHGCDDGNLGYHKYLVSHGSSHTDAFMNGYNDGYNACHSGDSKPKSGGQDKSQLDIKKNNPCNYYGLNICDKNGNCDNEHVDCLTDLNNGNYCTTGMCPGDDSKVCWKDGRYVCDDNDSKTKIGTFTEQQPFEVRKHSLTDCYSGDIYHPFFNTQNGKLLTPKYADCHDNKAEIVNKKTVINKNENTNTAETSKFKVIVSADNITKAEATQFQMRVIVYGPHTLNKPTLDKPGAILNIAGCVTSCFTTWDFTAWKVPVGSQISACIWNTVTGHQSCGHGLSHSIYGPETIHVSLPSSADSQNTTNKPSNENSLDSQIITESSKAPIAENNEVSISTGSSNSSNGQEFAPPAIAVGTDTTVTWTNNDDAIHTVTSGKPEGGNSGTEFDSLYLASGKNFQHVFQGTGQYSYYCTLHPYMTGIVYVTANVGSN